WHRAQAGNGAVAIKTRLGLAMNNNRHCLPGVPGTRPFARGGLRHMATAIRTVGAARDPPARKTYTCQTPILAPIRHDRSSVRPDGLTWRLGVHVRLFCPGGPRALDGAAVSC